MTTTISNYGKNRNQYSCIFCVSLERRNEDDSKSCSDYRPFNMHHDVRSCSRYIHYCIHNWTKYL